VFCPNHLSWLKESSLEVENIRFILKSVVWLFHSALVTYPHDKILMLAFAHKAEIAEFSCLQVLTFPRLLSFGTALLTSCTVFQDSHANPTELR
jgi:hypothetical protein